MRRDPHKALVAALEERLGPIDTVIAKTRDWSSATFTGMVHDLRFDIPWTPATVIAAIELPETDLPMEGHFVADLRVIRLDREAMTLDVTLEVLTIEDA